MYTLYIPCIHVYTGYTYIHIYKSAGFSYPNLHVYRRFFFLYIVYIYTVFFSDDMDDDVLRKYLDLKGSQVLYKLTRFFPSVKIAGK